MNHIEDGIVAAADAQSLGGKAPAYYLQPRNLLDNSDFTNAVNQRARAAILEILSDQSTDGLQLKGQVEVYL